MKEGELGKIYSDGEVIFKEGETGNVMYVIQSGKIKIIKKVESEEIAIATLHTGEIFGEMALFDRLPRSASAIADGNARVLSVDKKKLFSTISRDPTLVFKLLESMSQRIRKLDEDITKLKRNNTDVHHYSIDIDETCKFILDEARNVIKPDNGSVMLLDEDGGFLDIKAAFGSEAPNKMKFRAGEGIAGDVLKSGRAELINNVSMDGRFVCGPAGITSMLCVPLRYRDTSFGVINMSIASERLFTLDDLKLLHSLAIYASIAIQSAKNFANLKTVTDEVLRHATMLNM
ncbi:MAG TPA: cyclic nucleotide-binding domain-containing protein [Thermodesulfovibrionales bacterium]|nr:cyclic nucleotide-binding domain-containing protein [Thermodesulfovibrionales bacterium]